MLAFFIGVIMIINICETKDGDNVINKDFKIIKELDINIRNNFNFNSPILIIKIEDNNLLDCNYLTIPDFNLKYFIREINNKFGLVYDLVCELDLLETYKEVIMSSKYEYLRQIKNGDYVNINPDYLIKTVSSKIDCLVNVEQEQSIIISTLGG